MNDKENLFLTAVLINGRGVISLGLQEKVIWDLFAPSDSYGGDL